MDKKIINIYEDFKQRRLDRRGFLKKLSKIAGGTAAAAALLPLLENSRLGAQMVAKDNPRIHTEYVNYSGGTNKMRGHLARPKKGTRFPAVIVIHENKGLRPQTEDVTRRLALEGFLAIAPDALSSLGGTPKDENDARKMMSKLDREATVDNFAAAVKYLKTHPRTNGKVGCMGFCWGGGMTNQLAVRCPDLKAAVPFYGRQPAAEDVPKIKADLLRHNAGNDKRINAGMAAFEEALKKAGIKYKFYMYEGARHAFFNDTRPERYHKEASELAWKRTLAFFKEQLKSQP